MTAAYNIICFGFMPWNKMWKRNQSMMAELAKRDFVHRILFVNPTISLRSLFVLSTEQFSVTTGIRSSLLPLRVSPNIIVYQPVAFLPLKGKVPILKKFEEKFILWVIKSLNRHVPYILFMNCPNITSHNVLDRILNDAALSIFDFSDDFAELGYDERTKKIFHQNATKYARVANIVLGVNAHVKEKYLYLNQNFHVVRNATNYKNFNRESYDTVDELERIKQRGMPIIGYSGIANMSRIDGELLDCLLEHRPNWQFVFVGPAHENFLKRYSTRQNVHIFPPVVYEKLPSFLNYFDVAIVPFQNNENTRGNDLLKLHDFLAMGKPVVSTKIGGAEDLKDVIHISRTSQEFLTDIEELLRNKSDVDLIMRRKDCSRKNSWQTRVIDLETIVKGKLADKASSRVA